MGYLVNDGIKKFCKGKTIKAIITLGDVFDPAQILFTDGTRLKLQPYLTTKEKHCGCKEPAASIIVSPIKKDGQISY